MIISFWVEGEPRPQPRQRHSVAANNEALALVRAWKAQIERAACATIGRRWPPEKDRAPYFWASSLLDVRAVFYFTRRRVDQAAFPFPVAPTRKCYGDGDNLKKAVWDALTDAGIWSDDAQIVDWSGAKRFADRHARGPGALITVREVPSHEIDETGEQ